MEIYVNIVADGMCAWCNYSKSTGEFYLYNSNAPQDWNTDEYAGTSFTTIKAAKDAARRGKALASFEGAIKPKAKFFRFVGGKLVETKFTADNKIK